MCQLGANRATILIADDDQGFREATHRFLEGAREVTVVGEAANGDEAIQLARAFQPCVVLLDLVMPNLDGLEATRRIKAERPAAKVIILTVHDEDAYRKAAGESGADAFIVKKTVTDELLPAIRRIVGGGGGRPDSARSANPCLDSPAPPPA